MMHTHISRLETDRKGNVLNAQAHSAIMSCHACQQGLGDMKAHMSRLEKDRAAVAARKATGVSSPAVDSRLPSYMRQTAASAAMQKVSLLTHLSVSRVISVLWASKRFMHSTQERQATKVCWLTIAAVLPCEDEVS